MAKHTVKQLKEFFSKEHQQIAASIVEPLVQCAGQMAMHSPEYLRLVRELCDRHEVHLITDEMLWIVGGAINSSPVNMPVSSQTF